MSVRTRSVRLRAAERAEVLLRQNDVSESETFRSRYREILMGVAHLDSHQPVFTPCSEPVVLDAAVAVLDAAEAHASAVLHRPDVSFVRKVSRVASPRLELDPIRTVHPKDQFWPFVSSGFLENQWWLR